MFNKIWDQSSIPEKWSTEKGLILYMIEHYEPLRNSKIYYSNAPKQWRVNSDYIYYDCEFECENDKSILRNLALYCADEDILRALFDRNEKDLVLVYESAGERHLPLLYNANLPADIIDKIYESSNREKIRKMKDMKYKYISEETKEKIDAAVAECDAQIRKEREDITKQKLAAFLTTAAATKSVLSGNSIDDVVEKTITSDVDNAVLDYMNKLFDK